MGFFSKIFGGGSRQPKIEIHDLLVAVDEAGGDAVVEVPVKEFVDYIKQHGEIRTTFNGGFEGVISINGKNRKVNFSFGTLNNLSSNETFVSIASNSGIEENLEHIDVDSLGEALAKVLDDYIPNSSCATQIAYQIMSMTISGYNHIAIGQNKEALNSNNYPDFVNDFIDKVSVKNEYGFNKLNDKYKKEDMNFRQFNSVFESLTKDVTDSNTQLQINFSILKAIIKKYGI